MTLFRFHGAVDASEASKMLVKQPIGTFLVRFSSTPAIFVISVNYSGTEVGHWRISTDYYSEGVIFALEKTKVTNLARLIEKHSHLKSGSEPLRVKDIAIFLGKPLLRDRKQIHYSQMDDFLPVTTKTPIPKGYSAAQTKKS